MSEKLFTVGKVVNTHGIKGELKVISQTDFPEIRFKQGSVLLLSHPDHQELIRLTVQSARLHKNAYIVKFSDMDHINQVEEFKGGELKVPSEQLIDLPEDEYYFHEIVGCKVVTEEGEELGTISEILTPGANDVWVVERPKGKPLLIPVIDDVLINVEVDKKLVTIHLMEGLI
jgi:16S rRNA processing protein RimM